MHHHVISTRLESNYHYAFACSIQNYFERNLTMRLRTEDLEASLNLAILPEFNVAD
jgi:hypothetical protein